LPHEALLQDFAAPLIAEIFLGKLKSVAFVQPACRIQPVDGSQVGFAKPALLAKRQRL